MEQRHVQENYQASDRQLLPLELSILCSADQAIKPKNKDSRQKGFLNKGYQATSANSHDYSKSLLYFTSGPLKVFHSGELENP